MAYSLDDIFIDGIFAVTEIYDVRFKGGIWTAIANLEVKDIYDVSFKVKPNAHPVLMIECSVKEN